MNQPKTGSSNEYEQTTPRLFRLRDLHSPNAASPKSSAATSSVTGKNYQPQATTPSMPTPFTPTSGANPFAQEIVSEPHAVVNEAVDRFVHHSADESGYESPAQQSMEEPRRSTEQQGTRDRIERHLEVQPEGRSWMESAIAHRKALLLLVIAVGAAFWTSQDEREHADTDSEFAQSGGSLEFDSNQFDAGTIVDEGQAYIASETPSNSTSSDSIASDNNSAVSPASNDLTPPLPTEIPTGSNGSSAQASETTGLASDALAPSPTNDVAVSNRVNGTEVNSTEQIAADNDSQVQPYVSPETELAKTQIQTSGLQVQAVSSKTPHNPDFNAPSLGDLERAGVEPASNALGTELSLRDSSTPNGVTDWLKYLPPQQ